MNHNIRLLIGGSLLAGVAMVSGCASAPADSGTSRETEGLYDGDAQVLYDAKVKAKTGKEAMEYAEQALQVGNTDEALYQFVTAYELDPSRYMALYNVGLIQARKNNLDRAALAFNLALKVKPDHAGSLIELGLVELRMRRYEQARTHIEQAVESGAESWRAFNGLAVLADLSRQFESAEESYIKAVELNPGSPVIWNNRGYSRYLAGDWNDARRYIKKAIDIDSGYKKAWLNLGLIHVRDGAYDKALSAFERVMDTASAYERLGSLAMIEGKYDVAERFLYHAIDKSPTYYEAAYDKMDKLKTLRKEDAVYDGRVQSETADTVPRVQEGLDPGL